MKKFLPVIFAILLLYCVTLISPSKINAVTMKEASNSGLWVEDPEVTFIGKNAARSGYVLNWTLLNYQWVCVTKVGASNCDNAGNPLQQFWGQIVVWIVLPLLILVILASSMIIIITRGRSLTIMRFLPRFIAVLILIALSYALLQFLYQFFDMIQGFFLRKDLAGTCPPDCISDEDLLYVGWKYQDFTGLRMLGNNAESAFISLLLTKLTALTYFVMVGILLIRKVILWFFIIISPVFPLLLLFYPVRNTGKIWIGEFFRWLLYGPIFAIFLQGLVFMWKFKGGGGGGGGIPLQFNNPAIQDPNKIIYPTAVNILLGGPQQNVTLTNSVNLTETFMLYVIALIMLWIVILLPWILLQIFLDYASTFAGDNATMKTLVNLVSNKMVPPPAPSGYSPAPSQPGGIALNLPFTKRTVNIPIGPMPTGAAKEIIREPQEVGVARTLTIPLAQVSAEVMSFANIPLPTMRDVARYETALLSNNANQKQEVSRLQQTLEKIANPVAVTSTIERERYTNMKERLEKESQQGNIIATSILNAVNSAANNKSRKSIQISSSELRSVLQQVANPASVSNVVDRERMSKLHEALSHESKENNNQLASSILSVTDKTTARELDKIGDQLLKEQTLGNSVASTVINTVKASQIKNTLQQIANPGSITNATEREKISKLHDMLARESKEKNNELASSILQVKDSTSLQELEKITDKLQQSKESTVSSEVLSAINNSIQTSQSSTRVKSVLEQIANPASASTIDKEKINRLHEALTKESQKGNQLASSILSVNTQTSSSDIQKLQEKLREAKEKGQPLATDILDVAVQQATINIPATNRIQAVTPEELQEVRQMWKENYNNMEVPEGMAGTREQWIKDDIEKINSLKSLLTSSDQEKVNQGLSEVGSILPFLLVGGFSQSEIVSYLQAKQDAAKEVLESITREEETKVTVETKHTEAVQTMAANVEAPTVSMPTPSFEATTVVTPQVSNEILALVNLKIPKMRDIARFETMNLSRDKSQSTEVQKVRETLQSIANPATVTNTTERERFDKLRQKLLEESQKGNMTAELVLAAANMSQPKAGVMTIQTADIKSVLQQIVNPSQIVSVSEREVFTRLHETLVTESKEKNNELAKTILSVSDTTSKEELEKIKEQLEKGTQSGNSLASNVMSTINNSMQTTKMRQVLQQIAAPSTISSPVDRERMTKLHDSLVKAKEGGNELATNLLNINKTTTDADVQKLSEKLKEAQLKGESVASSVLASLPQAVSIPATNRIQAVTPEELQEVRQMWKENYNNMEVPEGMAGTREQWIKDDIEKINSLKSLLTSQDQEKVNQGLSEVGSILPFLLVGGFSQSEIVSYLQAKQDAAKEVLQAITREEETKVTVETKHTEAVQTMAANVEAPTVSMPTPSFEATTIVTPQVSNEILALVNLKIPKMRDIARFETMNLSRDKSQSTEVQKVREVLENLALPSKIQIPLEREKIEHLRERLIEESRKGNNTADLILIAASALDQKLGEITATTAEIKTVLQQIASPDFSPVDDRDFYTRLHDHLLKESKENNNELATKILSTTEETGASDIEGIKSQLIKEQKENKIASEVISAANRHVELKQMRNLFSQIANPAVIASPTNREHFSKLNEQLSKAGKEGDKLASSILEVKPTTKTTDIERLKKDLSDAKQKNDKLANALLSAMSSFIVPSDNTVQPVTEKDYEEIKKMWEENYRTLPVPFGFSDDKKGRIEWIDKEIEEISGTISLLTDPDSEKKNEGLRKVGTILPFLLLGGFSYQEIITYLRIKLEAAQTVNKELKSGEEKEEKVEVQSQAPKEEKTLAAENTDDEQK